MSAEADRHPDPNTLLTSVNTIALRKFEVFPFGQQQNGQDFRVDRGAYRVYIGSLAGVLRRK
jgi:hypothetical protein